MLDALMRCRVGEGEGDDEGEEEGDDEGDSRDVPRCAEREVRIEVCWLPWNAWEVRPWPVEVRWRDDDMRPFPIPEWCSDMKRPEASRSRCEAACIMPPLEPEDVRWREDERCCEVGIIEWWLVMVVS